MSTPSSDELQEVFKQHLPYELGRLIEQYHLLLDPEPYQSGLTAQIANTVQDAWIVSFCTHARNLLEFFFRTPARSYALSTHYADAKYKKLDPKRSDVKKLYGRLCAEINHLTFDRPHDDSKKIGSSERKDLVDLIHGEAVRLGRHLKAGYDKQHLRLDSLASAAAKEIKAGAVTTTNAVMFVSSFVGST